ncbi:MaoC family dehydratase [Mesorhizobium australafricanum]|uniref:MaoC family dehydratase n=1 Tax=Mesorhizobium australafricanum TaxID=3072311 RepID=A0ABU4X4S0_9HYPH|nr:MaoC family dehydratase [Mesorhizobium sp. VK3E]MDX8443340.1 MaoC family dehydratase [Mesorhizobium sp. VK3E]
MGSLIGVSPWMVVDQERIDAFADVTEDHQFIHVNPEAAAKGPFGKTIAHGFLSLSLLSRMAQLAIPLPGNVAAGINYGFDRVRFLAPVQSGTRVRARFTLENVTPRPGGRLLVRYGVDVEIENEGKPALSADWLTMLVFDDNPS